MPTMDRSNFTRTAYFCEENVWRLINKLVIDGIPTGNLRAVFFSNPVRQFAMLNQRAGHVFDDTNAADAVDAGGNPEPIAWDYHVVAMQIVDDQMHVLDLDSTLAFACAIGEYLNQSFPSRCAAMADEIRLWRPELLNAQARVIPTESFLQRFHSDRSHMLDPMNQPLVEFPSLPAILADDPEIRLSISDYTDVTRELNDGSVLMNIDELLGIQF